jgi:hypothetical protein
MYIFGGDDKDGSHNNLHKWELKENISKEIGSNSKLKVNSKKILLISLFNLKKN